MPDLLKSTFWVILATILAGCFEIKEEISITKSGAGHYQMLVDFSQSRSVIDKLSLGQDASADPMLRVEEIFVEGARKIGLIAGIANATTSSKDSQIFQLSFDFASVDALNYALDQLDRRNDYGNHQMYYSLKNRKLEKHNRFNLHRLLKGLAPGSAESEELSTHLQSITEQAKYRLSIQVEEKLKKVECQATYKYIDPRTVQLYAPISDILNKKVDFYTSIKFK